MAKLNSTVALRLLRLHHSGFTDHAIAAPICAGRRRGVMVGEPLTIGLAQGRIMSISRGSPPHKKR